MKRIIFLLTLTLTISCYGSKHRINDTLVLKYIDSINYYIDSLDIKEPYYVISQALWETGFFSCKNCTFENNNMFGFRCRSGKYMKFKNLNSCMIYYSNWQKKRYPKFKELYPTGTYLGFLKWCRFAESPNYSRVITETYNWLLKNWITD